MIEVFNNQGTLIAKCETAAQAITLIQQLGLARAQPPGPRQQQLTFPPSGNGASKPVPAALRKFAEYVIANRAKEVNGHDMAKVLDVEPSAVGPVTRGLRRHLKERGISMDEVFVRLNADDGTPARWTLHPNAELRKLVEEGV